MINMFTQLMYIKAAGKLTEQVAFRLEAMFSPPKLWHIKVCILKGLLSVSQVIFLKFSLMPFPTFALKFIIFPTNLWSG